MSWYLNFLLERVWKSFFSSLSIYTYKDFFPRNLSFNIPTYPANFQIFFSTTSQSQNRNIRYNSRTRTRNFIPRYAADDFFFSSSAKVLERGGRDRWLLNLLACQTSLFRLIFFLLFTSLHATSYCLWHPQCGAWVFSNYSVLDTQGILLHFHSCTANEVPDF